MNNVAQIRADDVNVELLTSATTRNDVSCSSEGSEGSLARLSLDRSTQAEAMTSVYEPLTSAMARRSACPCWLRRSDPGRVGSGLD